MNICSLASKGPLPYGVPYAAAKWGLAGATASLRAEYAGTGVGFSAVVPRFVTGAGIFARHEAAGVAAPRLFGTTTPEKVGRAVVAAIRRNAPEISVTPYPIRPFLALAALAPVTAQRLTTWVGVTAVARRVARLHGRIVEPPTQADATAGAARSPTAWPVNRDRMGGTNTMPRCRPPVTRASWNPLRLLSLDEVVGQFGGDAPAWLWPVTMATTFRTVFRAIRAAGHGRTARRGAAHLGRT